MKPAVIRRTYLREAAFMLVLARLAVRFVPARRLVSWASRPPRRINRFAGHQFGLVARAVEAVGDKKWMRAKCLPRALAAQAMLRRRGIPSKLCLGVARKGEALAAHAWLEFDHQIITGGDSRPRYTRLAEFGGERT
jgi:hypothetical protein